MSVVNAILCLFIGILTIIFIFNAIATVGAGLLGMAIGLLQLIVILPWILLEKITGIEPPAWALKLADAIGWLHPAKWIR